MITGGAVVLVVGLCSFVVASALLSVWLLDKEVGRLWALLEEVRK